MSYSSDSSHGSATISSSSNGGPLTGVRVIAIEQAVAAPLATRQLADLGAEVIKVERPVSGDVARSYDETVNGLSSYFVWLNRTKKSIQLDLKRSEGQKVLERLLESADVLVSNLGPGALQRLGFGPEETRVRFPRLINCLITGFDIEGPWHDRKSYDLIAQGEAGLISITGDEDHPAKAGISIADIATGMYAFSGILTALLHREKTNAVTNLVVSVFDSLMEWMGAPMYYTWYGGAPPERTGTAHATIAPYGPYQAADGSVILAVHNQREWDSFCRMVLEDDSLIDDERYSKNSARVKNRETLDKIINDRTGQLSSADLVSLLKDAGIAYGHLNTIDQLETHPLIVGAKTVKIESEVGPLNALVPPTRFSEFQSQLAAVPALGENTREVLHGIGLTNEEIARLEATGVI